LCDRAGTRERDGKKVFADAYVTELLAALNGAALYTSNCAGGHGALATSTKRTGTATQIANAIANVGSMSGISLTPAEITAIAAALL